MGERYATHEEFQATRSAVNRMQGGVVLLAFVLSLGWLTGFLTVPRGEIGPPGTPGISIPVGGIIAWPGDEPPASGLWAVCNGGPFDSGWDHEGLRAALGAEATQLPSLQGQFLRGFDPNTGEHGVDRGPRSHDRVLSTQEHAIGTHDHPMNVGTDVFKTGFGDDHLNVLKRTGNIQKLAAKTHIGPETRPVNTAVNWLMRVK